MAHDAVVLDWAFRYHATSVQEDQPLLRKIPTSRRATEARKPTDRRGSQAVHRVSSFSSLYSLWSEIVVASEAFVFEPSEGYAYLPLKSRLVLRMACGVCNTLCSGAAGVNLGWNYRVQLGLIGGSSVADSSRQLGLTFYHLAPLYKLVRAAILVPWYGGTLPTPFLGTGIKPIAGLRIWGRTSIIGHILAAPGVVLKKPLRGITLRLRICNSLPSSPRHRREAPARASF